MTAQKIETAVGFKRDVVDLDYAEYKSHPIDLRRAYHLALGLFHLRDWTFWQYKGESGWKHGTLGRYQKYLEKQCSDFGYMRDLANAVKHAELDPTKRPSTEMVGLANTAVSSAGFQSNAFQGDAFQTKTFIVSQTSASQRVAFEQAADAVMNMWNELFRKNVWK